MEYRGHKIVAVFDGYKIQYPGGAWSPEKYRDPGEARKSIDFNLRRQK